MAKRRPAADPLTRLINANFKTDTLLAEALGVTRQTAQRKRSNPESLTVRELRRMKLRKDELGGAI